MDNVSYTRRAALGAVGTATVTAGFSSVSTAKSEDNRESMGLRLFAEVAIHHDKIPDVWLPGNDPTSHYAINMANNKLYLKQPIGKRKFNTIKNNNQVIGMSNLSDYYPIGSVIPERIRNGPQVDTLRWLQTQNEYARPKISTGLKKSNAISIEVENKSKTIEPKTYSSFELAPIEVEYLRETSATTEVDARRGQTKTVPKRVTSTTKITPIVKISNHGELETYKPREVKGR